MKYYEYLKTAHFINIRKKALEFWGNKCSLCCNFEDLHIHHNNYLCLFKETEKDVLVLCKNCHEKFHNISSEPIEINNNNDGFRSNIKLQIQHIKNELTLLKNNLPIETNDYLISKHWGYLSTPEQMILNRENILRDLENRLEIEHINEMLNKIGRAHV